MAVVFGHGEAVFMEGEMANNQSVRKRPNRDLSSVNRFREKQRKRRQYQRRASANPLVFQPRPARPQGQPPLAPPVRQLMPNMMRLLFEKQLQKSDVSPAGRIVIPKKYAEMYLPALAEKEGIWMHIDDMDFQKVWTFRFRYWPNNYTRMYVFENARDFTKVRRLESGDFLMVFRDDQTGSYALRARKNVDQVANHTMNANLNANTNVLAVEECGSPILEDSLCDYLMSLFNGTAPVTDLEQLELSPSIESQNLSHSA